MSTRQSVGVVGLVAGLVLLPAVPSSAQTTGLRHGSAAVSAPLTVVAGAVVTGKWVDVTATVTAGDTALTDLVVRTVDEAGTFSCAADDLVPAQSTRCTLRQLVSQADRDTGALTGTVAASASAEGEPVAATPATFRVAVPGTASLTLSQQVVQRADRDRDARLDVGDTVQVLLTAHNRGTRTLNRLVVTDSTLARLKVVLRCTDTRLAPGESTTCRSGTFSITRAMGLAGRLRNQATASARTLTGGVVRSATSTASVSVQAPAAVRPRPSTTPAPPKTGPTAVARLRLTQWVLRVNDVDRDGRLDAGDSVVFAFRAANVGTSTLRGLQVVDRRLQRAGVAVSCPVGTLAPGRSTVCTSGAVPVTARQAKKGFGRNFAFATARTLSGLAVRSNATVTELGRAAAAGSAVSALPRTGAAPAGPLGLAAVLLLGGTALVAAAGRQPARLRRRRDVS